MANIRRRSSLREDSTELLKLVLSSYLDVMTENENLLYDCCALNMDFDC